MVEDGLRLPNLDTGEPLDSLDGLVFATAYLGAYPVVEALDRGAQVVVTGRIADTSVYMAPAIHEYGVAKDDWTRLGRLAAIGHLIECSSQATGGNFSRDWWAVDGLERNGFPIAEVEADGNAVITKPKDSGGRVSFDTLKEQLLYEVNDPSRYHTPDVVTRLDAVQFEDLGGDRVRVTEGDGHPATDSYKVILFRRAGWGASVTSLYTWPDAMAKARKAAHILDERLPGLGVDVLDTRHEFVGAGAVFGEATPPEDAPEIVLRYSVRCATEKEAHNVIAARNMLLGLAGPPGATGLGASVRPLSRIWPTLIRRDLVDPGVRVTVEEF
jgi:hypothetical protein